MYLPENLNLRVLQQYMHLPFPLILPSSTTRVIVKRIEMGQSDTGRTYTRMVEKPKKKNQKVRTIGKWQVVVVDTCCSFLTSRSTQASFSCCLGMFDQQLGGIALLTCSGFGRRTNG